MEKKRDREQKFFFDSPGDHRVEKIEFGKVRIKAVENNQG